MKLVWRLAVGLFLGAMIFLGPMTLTAQAAVPPDGENWPSLKFHLFGDRVIQNDDGARLSLELPARAADAGAVPVGITIRSNPGESGVRKVYIVIDKNPSPVGAIFDFGGPRKDFSLETRVRIEDYTWVRIIAEREDGSLIGAKKFIKAAGGCSAPAGKSIAERHAGMGRMKWRIGASRISGAKRSVQLLIKHPNDSGLAMDQLTRLYDPAMFVNKVRISRGGVLILEAQVDFSISQNPAFRFTLPEGGSGDLRAEVSDTDGRLFESTFTMRFD